MNTPASPNLKEIDRWTVWFFRVAQVGGLAAAAYEVVLRKGGAQATVLLFAAATMLGPAGMRLLLKGAAGLLEETAKGLGDERKDR